jgi:hypothetical protein
MKFGKWKRSREFLSKGLHKMFITRVKQCGTHQGLLHELETEFEEMAEYNPPKSKRFQQYVTLAKRAKRVRKAIRRDGFNKYNGPKNEPLHMINRSKKSKFKKKTIKPMSYEEEERQRFVAWTKSYKAGDLNRAETRIYEDEMIPDHRKAKKSKLGAVEKQMEQEYQLAKKSENNHASERAKIKAQRKAYRDGTMTPWESKQYVDMIYEEHLRDQENTYYDSVL